MNSQTLILIGGAVLLFLYLRGQPPRTVSPYTARTFPEGGWGVNIPGIGQVQTGKGGTFLQMDPALFKNLTTGGGAAGITDPNLLAWTPQTPGYQGVWDGSSAWLNPAWQEYTDAWVWPTTPGAVAEVIGDPGEIGSEETWRWWWRP